MFQHSLTSNAHYKNVTDVSNASSDGSSYANALEISYLQDFNGGN